MSCQQVVNKNQKDCHFVWQACKLNVKKWSLAAADQDGHV